MHYHKRRICDCDKTCSSAKKGGTTYTYENMDLRMFPGIQRDSDDWNTCVSLEEKPETIPPQSLTFYVNPETILNTDLFLPALKSSAPCLCSSSISEVPYMLLYLMLNRYSQFIRPYRVVIRQISFWSFLVSCVFFRRHLQFLPTVEGLLMRAELSSPSQSCIGMMQVAAALRRTSAIMLL